MGATDLGFVRRPADDSSHQISEFSTQTIRARALGLPLSARYELVGHVPPTPRIAVVGSRAARRSFCEHAARAVELAGALGWTLVSGGAIGIDAAAHRAALEHEVAQLAVLPCGPDRPYPAQHVELFQAIVASEGSGLLFAQPRGTAAARAMFASRNRVVVGLADAVLVVQAGSRSGSVVTGRLARRHRVPLAAVCGSPGCSMLIGDDARALPGPPPIGFVASGPSFRERLRAWLLRVDPRENASTGEIAASASDGAAWPDRLRWLARALDQAGPGGLWLDAAEDPAALIEAITEAEALGLIIETRPGRYRRCD